MSIQKFNEFYEKFLTTDLAKTMASVSENSPYHREENVLVHTQMTMNWYKENLAPNRSEHQQVMTLLALLFHDTGKPIVKQEKFREDRGNYLSFADHEQASARVLEDFAMQDFKVFLDMGITQKDLAALIWMVEYHLPYDMVKPEKRQAYRDTVFHLLGCEDEVAYGDMLLSDAHGRTSDDQEAKRAKTVAWVKEFELIKPEQPKFTSIADKRTPMIFILIGASGSGKSTYTETLRILHQGINVFSLDTIRLRLAHSMGLLTGVEIEDYRIAYENSITESLAFSTLVSQTWMELIRSKADIIVDNTNLSRKSRARWINESKAAGYYVSLALFPIAKNILVKRACTREDKRVPIGAVIQHFESIRYPLLPTEGHSIVVVKQG